MVKARQGLRETRTRVTFFLPANNPQEQDAVKSTIDYLESQRTTGVRVSGFTRSQFTDPVYIGYWWSDKHRKWYRERVVLFLIDYGLNLEDESLSRALNRLKRAILKSYRACGSRQEEIWIIAERAQRLV